MADALEELWTSIAPPAGGLERVAVGEVPSAILDRDVEFTVYRPKALPTRSYAKLVAFAHRQVDDAERALLSYDDPTKEVERRAEEVLGPAHEHARERGPAMVGIPRGHQITFVPRAAGVVFDPPSRTFAWTEPVHREVFLARAEGVELGARIEVVLEVFLGALLLAEVRFALEVGDDAGPGESQVTARPFSRVFVSYADGDAAVAEQIRTLSALLTGARYSESSGEERRSQVLGASGRAAIEAAEAVQLLWSEAALASPLVDDEIRHAIARRGPQVVRPVCWKLPPPVDEARDRPPKPVRALAFTSLLAPANALLAAVAGGSAVAPAPAAPTPMAPAPTAAAAAAPMALPSPAVPAAAAPFGVPPVTSPGFGALSAPAAMAPPAAAPMALPSPAVPAAAAPLGLPPVTSPGFGVPQSPSPPMTFAPSRVGDVPPAPPGPYASPAPPASPGPYAAAPGAMPPPPMGAFDPGEVRFGEAAGMPALLPMTGGASPEPRARSGVRPAVGVVLGVVASVAALVLFLFFRDTSGQAVTGPGRRDLGTSPSPDRSGATSPTTDPLPSAWPTLDEDAGRDAGALRANPKPSRPRPSIP
jgi:hypothetical protein